MKQKIIKKLMFIFALVFFCFSYAYSASNLSVIKNIIIKTDEIRIEATKKAKINIIILSNRELLLVINDAIINKTAFQKIYKKNSIASEVATGNFKSNSISFIFDMRVKFKIGKGYWLEKEATFILPVEPLEMIIIKEETVIDRENKLRRYKKNLHSKYYKKFKTKYQGSIDDIVNLMITSPHFNKNKTLKKLKQSFINKETHITSIILKKEIKKFKKIDKKKFKDSDEIMYYLYSYSLLSEANLNDSDELFKLEDLFLNVLAFFPKSKYKPFLYAFLAKIKLALHQNFEAVAYFKIILNKYPNYIGTPEILHKFATIKLKNNKTQEVIKFLRELLYLYPKSNSAKESIYELASALFKERVYRKTISNLKNVLKNIPNIEKKNPDFLWMMGESYFKLKKYNKALPVFIKFHTFFPKDKRATIVLKKIGDLYLAIGKKKEAMSIYRLIVKKYSGSDSFVLASFEITKLIKDNSQKEKIFKDIIKNYPNHKLIREVLIRFAVVQNDSGKYEDAIDTSRELLSMGNVGYLKQQAFGIIFEVAKGYFKEGRYEEVLSLIDELKRERFEIEQTKMKNIVSKTYNKYFFNLVNEKKFLKLISIVDKNKDTIESLNSADIYFCIAKSYFNFLMFDKAYFMFQKSYDIYKQEKRLFFDIVFEMAETAFKLNNNNEALALFLESISIKNSTNKAFATSEKEKKIYIKIATIYIKQKEYEFAISYLNKAYTLSKTIDEKVYVLNYKANIYKEKGDNDKFILVMQEVIVLLLNQTKIKTEKIFTTYKNMGEVSYIANDYENALKYFKEALNSSLKNTFDLNLYFKIGDINQKLHNYDEAKKIYNTILKKTDDIFFIDNIKQKIQEMEINKKITN